MKYCKKCLYSENHPLGITFDDFGVCSGCTIHLEKDQIDWNARKAKLVEFIQDFRCKNGSNYDCIVPVSGARDSYFIVHVVKNELKLNPLLVSYNQIYNTPVGIRNLAYLRTIMNCDFMQQTVNPEAVKRITKCTLDKIGSMYWHILAGQTAYPVQLAVRLKIPLIIWGVHQGCDQVGMFSHLDEVEMTRKYRKEHDLMGIEAENLLDEYSQLNETDMIQYRYPHDKEIEAVGVRGIYLSNYYRWDSIQQHELMVRRYGYAGLKQRRTFDSYNDAGCFHYSGLHDYIKFLKFGYGKATDHATREIRLKRLSREQALSLVDKYKYRKPLDLEIFLNWLGLSEKDFKDILAKHSNSSVSQICEEEKQAEYDNPLQCRNLKDEEKTPAYTPILKKESKITENQYTIVGKGFVENYERSRNSPS